MRIACLAPRKDMVDRAWQTLMKNGVNYQAYGLTIDYGSNFYAKEWIRKIKEGPDKPDIIIARGLQATLIKLNSAIPIVEVRLTAQEMSLLIVQAVRLAGKERPRIGVIGNVNQYCDMEYFDEIFGIELHRYLVPTDQSDVRELADCAHQAVLDGMDVIIGGDVALEVARKAGVPNLYIQSTGDSFWEAFRTAKSMAYAIEQERIHASRFRTLLDNAFSSIICMDHQGRVTLINQVAEMQLGWNSSAVAGRPIGELVNDLGGDALSPVLAEGKTVFSRYIDIGPNSMVANISPIVTESGITGAVLSAQQVKQLEEMGSAARRHQWTYQLPRGARQDIGEPSPAIREAAALARQYADSEFPVLIVSEPGNDQIRFARLIHERSRRSAGEFVYVNCAEIAQEEQEQALFGAAGERGGLVRAANGGTLYLENVDRLSPVCRQRLLSVLKYRTLLDTKYRSEHIRVRVVASAPRDLAELGAKGEFDSELYYALNTLSVTVPPLRERREDISYWTDQFLMHYRERYKRYITLTAGGKQQLMNCRWDGNAVQLRAFCQHLILSARRRTIDEVDVRRLYEKMYPVPAGAGAPPLRADAYPGGEAETIAGTLRRCGGSRSRAAAALGISTTTLWRKIKKYDLTDIT